MAISLNTKGNKKLILFGVLFIISFFYFIPTLAPQSSFSTKFSVSSSYQTSTSSNNNNHHEDDNGASQYSFKNLNQAPSSQDKILVLTPLKDAAPYLERYFELLDQTTYPNHLISLAFLVSDTTDNTLEELAHHADKIQSRFWWKRRFNDIRVFTKDFKFDLPNDQRHKYEMQPLRRSVMARSRNYLLSSALRDEFQYVAWVDVDVVKYPTTIFEDLIAADEDVVVPNCLLDRQDGKFFAYDRNNWQETDQSMQIQKDLDDEFVLLEGYYEFPTHRYLMVDMPTHLDKNLKVPLDGVGATFTMVRANVHREGANFPAYPFHHQVETEGFAKMAKAMGFSVVGLPSYLIHHIENH